MGGCYDNSFSHSRQSSCSTRERDYSQEYQKQKARRKISEFFSRKNTEDLIEAYRVYTEQLGNKAGFFKQLLDYKNVKEAPKEIDGVEIESKLEIVLKAENGSKQEPKVEKILDAIEFPPTISARFIKDSINTSSVGKNSFFGTDGGEEKFVIIEKGGGWYLKEKGNVEPYSFGIPGEQLVLRRKETRIATDPLKAVQTIMEKYRDTNVKYQGVIEKIKSDAYLLNTLTGRMYGMTVSDAAAKGRRQVQLEVEYAGYIPGFEIDKDCEKSIVEDIVNINKHVLLFCNESKISPGWRMSFRPTQERKYDFVSDNKKQIPKLRLEKLLDVQIGVPSGMSRKELQSMREEVGVR